MEISDNDFKQLNPATKTLQLGLYSHNSTISLFKAIMKSAGPKFNRGRSKGSYNNSHYV